MMLNMMLNSIYDLNEIHDKIESNTLELKERHTNTDKLLKSIEVFLNGNMSECRIIIGVTAKDGRSNINDLKYIQYHITITNKGKSKIFNNFDEYKLHLFSSLSANYPKYEEGLVDIQELCNSLGSIICITVKQSNSRPILHKDREMPYMRIDGANKIMSYYQYLKECSKRDEREAEKNNSYRISSC